jgi:branched-chain amino acid transport system permease protein
MNDILLLMLVGGLTAVVIGFVIAIPALRFGGWSLAMASFFLVLTIPDISSIFSSYTGGLQGLIGIPIPELFGVQLGNTGLYETTLVATIVWMVLYRNLVTSRYGVVLRALRESPTMARSLGFSPRRLKTLTYSLGAFPAGVAGCLYGYISLVLVPTYFGLSLAVGVLAASILGGVESVYGVAIGAAVIQLGPQQSLAFANYAPIGYGCFLIFSAVVFRRGISGVATYVQQRAADWIAGRAVLRSPAAHPVEDDLAPIQLEPLPGRVLEVEKVSKSFGGVRAVRDVSLKARPGAVTALIGSNGSGKTTMLNLICGYNHADSGFVRLNSVDLTKLAADRRAALGLGRTFQTPTVPRGVPTWDVVASGRYRSARVGPVAAALRLPKYRRQRRADRAGALFLLETVGLADLADLDAASLPLGLRRLVEVARCLAGQPGVVLLDEPASGLSSAEVERLGAIVRAAAGAGATVILIEHNFAFVRSVADVTYVLHLGEIIASGPAAAIETDAKVIESYLGSSTSAMARRVPRPSGAVRAATGRPLLSMRDVESGYGDLRVLRGVSLDVPAGSIEVILGRNGVGKTTLLSTIAGRLPVKGGSVELDSRSLVRLPAYRCARRGISMVQEGKQIFRHRSIWENVMLGTHSLRMSRRARAELCNELLSHFPVLLSRSEEQAGGLSGGQQQMLAIVQALASRPRVLLLDEPSAGLGPLIVREVFDRIRILADNGLSVVLVEQLAEEAMGIADHVTILNDGVVVASGPPARFDDVDELHASYFGVTHS